MIYSAYTSFQITGRAVEATIYADKLMMLMPKKIFFQRTKKKEIRFENIASFEDNRDEDDYSHFIKIKLRNGKKYNIEPHSSQYIAIINTGKRGFNIDLIAAFNKFTKDPFIIKIKFRKVDDVYKKLGDVWEKED